MGLPRCCAEPLGPRAQPQQQPLADRAEICGPARFGPCSIDGAFIADLLFGRRRARFLFHIVTEQHIFITQIQPTARDHGMAEGGETAPIRLPEPAFLLVAVRYGFDQRDFAALAADVQLAVRHDQRSLADATVPPLGRSGLEVHANEPGTGGAVDVVAYTDDTAVMVEDRADEIDLLGTHLGPIHG